MRSPVGWCVVMIGLSLIAFSVAVVSAYPRYLKTVQGAVEWGLFDSAVFLVGAVISGLFAARRTPLPTFVLVLLVLLLGIGTVWAFIYLVVLGL